jgi:MYXO-CTERM domain-containing protein
VVPPDPGVDVLATGGGGFSCEVGAVGARSGSALWLLFFAAAIAVFRRRR